jgi:ribosomal protein S18 acetylase RimI-like enzyme
MPYRLVPAVESDEPWLERLRREAYRELFDATFGGWDEARHARQFSECWKQGGISIVEVDGTRVGMIQLFERPGGVEVGEIQILPGHQNLGIGSWILRYVILRSHEEQRKVLLSVGLKNERAYQLYEHLGFKKVASSDTHNHMCCEPPSTAGPVSDD